MRSGRPPKPTKLKLIEGNRGHRPINRDEPQVPPALLDPPDHLSELAKEEWRQIQPQLFHCGIMTTLDRSTLEGYCQSYGDWVEYRQIIARMAARDEVTRGLLLRTANGFRDNPLVHMANRAKSDFLRFAGELGMTPSARTRINTAPPLDADPARRFFDGRRPDDARTG